MGDRRENTQRDGEEEEGGERGNTIGYYWSFCTALKNPHRLVVLYPYFNLTLTR